MEKNSLKIVFDFLLVISGNFQFLSQISTGKCPWSQQWTILCFSPDSSLSGGLNKIVLAVVGWCVYVEMTPINCVSPTTQSWAG